VKVQVNIVVFAFIIALYSCDRPEHNIEQDLLPERDYFNDKFLVPVSYSYCPPDSSFWNLFEESNYEEIVRVSESKDNESENFPDEISDFRRGIYFISKAELDGEWSMEFILNQFDSRLHHKPSKFWPRYVYTDSLVKILGPYETFALLVYDFMEYKRFSQPFLQLEYSMYAKLGDQRESNIFFRVIDNTISQDTANVNSFLDSVNQEFAQWTFIDSLKLHYQTAKLYQDSLK
jgi:hypothetical protein